MDGYDQNTMPYLPNTLAYTNVATQDFMNTLPPLSQSGQSYQTQAYTNHDFGG